MARNEGVRRIMMTGKLIVLIGITLAALFLVIMMFGLEERFLSPPNLLLGFLALRVVALGALVSAAGWIAQGFIQAAP